MSPLSQNNSLFIYGTLLSAQVRDNVLGKSKPDSALTEAIAPFYKVMKVAGVHYPCLLSGNDADLADGAILSDVTDDDLALLDRFEGGNYERRPIEVISDNQLVITQAYFPKITLATDGPWSFESWQQEEQAAFLDKDFDLDGVRPPA